MTILIVVTSIGDTDALVHWGMRFGAALEHKIAILSVTTVRGSNKGVERVGFLSQDGEDDPGPELRRIRDAIADVRGVADDAAAQKAQAGNDADHTGESTGSRPIPTVWRLRDEQPLRAIYALIDELDASMVLVARGSDKRPSVLAQSLLEHAPCQTMIVRAAAESGLRCQHILVPAAGGANARAALRMANDIATHDGCHVTAFYVQDPRVDEADAVGAVHLRRALVDARVESSPQIRRRVVVHASVQEAIAEAAADYDLVIVGASDHRFIGRLLQGTLGDHLLSGPGGVAMAVLRRGRPWHSRLLQNLQEFLIDRVPQMSRDRRVELAESLHSGSTASFDFVVLIVLSTSIAGLGLIQNSTAVVVGAMLVAPLMTPIVGAGLGLVQGNALLVRNAAKAIAVGFLLALLVGVVLGGLVPMAGLTDELLGRGKPNLLDLFVALVSGMAAAYAMSRPNLSAALPGVAIAAALVPPIATVGICLAQGSLANANGAALLFGTNVVAIILGSAVTLYAVGLRPARSRQWSPLWVSRLVLALLLVIAVLAIPLTSVFIASLRQPEQNLFKQVEHHLHQQDIALSGLRLVDKNPPRYAVTIQAAQQPPAEVMTGLQQFIAQTTEAEQVRLSIEVELVINVD